MILSGQPKQFPSMQHTRDFAAFRTLGSLGFSGMVNRVNEILATILLK
jgi:hypothetical protein